MEFGAWSLGFSRALREEQGFVVLLHRNVETCPPIAVYGNGECGRVSFVYDFFNYISEKGLGRREVWLITEDRKQVLPCERVLKFSEHRGKSSAIGGLTP